MRTWYQRQHTALPGWQRGFNSRRPLHVAVVSAAARDLAMVVGRVQISPATPNAGGGMQTRGPQKLVSRKGREGASPSRRTEGWPSW
jgi:hypothetical protein